MSVYLSHVLSVKKQLVDNRFLDADAEVRKPSVVRTAQMS